MKVVFFPANKLNISVEPIYNGHIAVVSNNTDRLKDNKYELAELELFRANLQGTSYLNPRGDLNLNENDSATYVQMVRNVQDTGRISFGLYFNTDAWIDPITEQYSRIPDFYREAWTAEGKAYFPSVIVGASKAAQTPRHGQELFNISGGLYGYDYLNGIAGTSNQKELTDWIAWQNEKIKKLIGREPSIISYMSGHDTCSKSLIPYYLGGRNSLYRSNGDSEVGYGLFSRTYHMARRNATRTRGVARWGEIPTVVQSIAYSMNELQDCINVGGWYQDFFHWHLSFELATGSADYLANRFTFFKDFFSAQDTKIGTQDVWRAGEPELIEYEYLKGNLGRLGSFEHENQIACFYRIDDIFESSSTNGIPNKIDFSKIRQPLSYRINTSGTYLAGKNIKCDVAQSIRKLPANEWIINVPFQLNEKGYGSFVLYEGTAEYYTNQRPVITVSGNNITTDLPCKVVVWRKATADGIELTKEYARINTPGISFNVVFESGYNYYIGAITKFNQSSLIEI